MNAEQVVSQKTQQNARKRPTHTFSQHWQSFFDKPFPNMLLRLIVMMLGLCFVAMGVALSRATGLGTSPISCVPAVLSFITPLTIGTFTFLMNLIFVAIQIILLRSQFHPLQLLQVIFVFIFSLMIDFFVPIYAAIPMTFYPVQILGSFVACTFTAFGVFLQVKAALIMLPGDGVVLTIARLFEKDLSKCKIAFDWLLVIIAAIASLACLGGLFGVREGTVIMALCTGLIMKVFHLLTRNLGWVIPLQGHLTLTPKEQR